MDLFAAGGVGSNLFYEVVHLKKDVFSEYPDVVSIDDLRKMLHIGRNSAYKLVKEGAIITVRVGKRYIIPKLNVIEYLNTNK